MKDQHVVVTGASSGIGEAIAREFASAGARLTLVARRREAMEELARSTGARCQVVAQDLSEPERATEWIEEAERELGPVQVLVNNAGMQIIGPTAQGDVEAGERLLRLNLFTPLRLTRALLPGMIERGTGTIVDIASLAALAPTANMTYYNASKGALAAASEALRGELAGTGVHVVTVYPGIIPTDMGSAGLASYKPSVLLRFQPQGTPQGLARHIRAAVQGRRARVIYPRANAITRWLPPVTRYFMDRFTPPLAEHG